MRILFYSREYPTRLGGGGIGSYVAVMARALVARGHEVHVLSCLPGQGCRDENDQGVVVHRRPLLGPVGTRWLRYMSVARLWSARSAWQWTRREGLHPDVIETPDWMAEGLFAALSGRTPVVAQVHSPLAWIARYADQAMSYDLRLGDFLERATVCRATAISVPSTNFADELHRSGWLRGRAAEVIPLPVAISDRAAPFETAQMPGVLFAGRLERRKAPEVLVDALIRLAADGVPFEARFVGRPSGSLDGAPYDVALKRRAAVLGARVSFSAEVEHAHVRALYRWATVVVVPSRWESFSMVAAEAMAEGRPVVCSSACGIAELLSAQGAGTVVPPDDAEALAAALRPFLTNPAAARAAGNAALELVGSVLDPSAIARRREWLYERALSSDARLR